VSGGPVVVVCDAPTGRGGSWGDNGWIVFTPNASGNTTLQRVSASGGAPEQLTTLRAGDAAQRWPQVLPGGRGVIYSTTSNLGSYNDGEIVVQPPDGDQKVILRGGFFGRYLRSGHPTYVHDGRLFAVPFDLQRLEIVGSPVPILERVSTAVSNGGAQFDVSDTGIAAYVAVEAGLARPLGMPVELLGAGEHREVGRGQRLRRHDCLSLKVAPTTGREATGQPHWRRGVTGNVE
jgi:serine/threonine-protein kinase